MKRTPVSKVSHFREADRVERARVITRPTSAVGHAAIVYGWSTTAGAERGDLPVPLGLAPGDYTLPDDSTVIFQLPTGKQVQLSESDYLLLDDGFLLFADELALSKLSPLLLPVLGEEVVQTRSGEVVRVTNRDPLLTEQIVFERYDLAQNSVDGEEQEGNNLWIFGSGSIALLLGLPLIGSPRPDAAPVALEPEPEPVTLSASLLTSALFSWDPTAGSVASVTLSDHVSLTPATAVTDVTATDLADASVSAGSVNAQLTWSGAITQSGATTNGAHTSWEAHQDSVTITGFAPSSSASTTLSVTGRLLLIDENVAPSSSVTLTGVGADDYVGFSAANLDSASPLSALAKGISNTATIDLGGGNNTLRVGDDAGASGGKVVYTGGSGDDFLRFGNTLAKLGAATITMTAGGTNRIIAETDVAVSGVLNFTGGSGATDFNFDNTLGKNGTVVFDMSRGGDNTFEADYDAASSGGSLTYTGGPDNDSIDIEGDLAKQGTARFDMSLGGNNVFEASYDVAETDGSFTYIGGAGSDTLIFEEDLGIERGSVEIDMSRGGNNSLTMGEDTSEGDGNFTYTGGADTDSLTFSHDLSDSGTVTFNMQLGGTNSLTAADSAAEIGLLTYNGGSGADNLDFGNNLAWAGTATFNMTLGGTNTLNVGENAARLWTLESTPGNINYNGGTGVDTLAFGNFAGPNGGNITLDLGSDSASDSVTFEGTVEGTVEIYNFDPSNDGITLKLPTAVTDVVLSTTIGSSSTLVTSTDISFVIAGVTAGQLGKSLSGTDVLIS